MFSFSIKHQKIAGKMSESKVNHFKWQIFNLRVNIKQQQQKNDAANPNE